MTHLTLYWHLRAIVEGTTDDAYTTGGGQYAPKDGRVCTAYADGMAADALQSDDCVAHLDAVAHDPCAPLQWRIDAQELLETHIMERRLICYAETRGISHDDEPGHAEMRNAFIEGRKEGRISKPSMGSDFWWPAECPNPNCREGECLFDPDKPDEPNHCTVCGTKVPMPEYPA